MRISLCIPCSSQHFFYLERLIQTIKQSKIQPDEIVVSASGFGSEQGVLDAETALDRLGVDRFACFLDRHNAAENRNLCYEMSSGDILSFHDADDLSHPERISMVKSIFDSRQCAHVLTGLSISEPHPTDPYNDEYEVVDLSPLHPTIFKDGYPACFTHRDFWQFRGVAKNYNVRPITNGTPTILREVMQEVKYKSDPRTHIVSEDQDFNFEVFWKFNQSFVIPEPIYFYNMAHRSGGGF